MRLLRLSPAERDLRPAIPGRAALTLLLLVLPLSACSHDAPASTRKVPDYPGATGWQERPLDANDNLLNIYRAGTFSTTDSPERVLSFYRDTLTNDNWQLDSFQPDPRRLVFKWSSYEQPPAQYLFQVRAEETGTGKTKVDIEQRFNPGG